MHAWDPPGPLDDITGKSQKDTRRMNIPIKTTWDSYIKLEKLYFLANYKNAFLFNYSKKSQAIAL